MFTKFRQYFKAALTTNPVSNFRQAGRNKTWFEEYAKSHPEYSEKRAEAQRTAMVFIWQISLYAVFLYSVVGVVSLVREIR